MSSSTPAGGPFKAAVGLHEPLNASLINQARRLLSNYCSSPGHARLCLEAVRITRTASQLVARARFEDLLFNDKYSGADKPLFRLLQGVVEFYARLIGGFIVTYGDKPMVEVRAGVSLGGLKLEPGEVVLLPLAEAAFLSALGMVEPVESNLLKSTSSWRSEGGGASGTGGVP